MRNIKSKLYIAFILVLVALYFTSCKKDEETKPTTIEITPAIQIRSYDIRIVAQGLPVVEINSEYVQSKDEYTLKTGENI